MEDTQIKSVLSQYLDELWLEARFKLHQIKQKLADLLVSSATDSGKQPNRELVLDWIQFLEFLQDQCAGHLFTNDKQWNELMARMDISRKLNHRSVKLRDVIKNKQLIQTNHLAIRQLNRSVKLAQTIEQSLAELEQNIEGCQLNCANLLDDHDNDNDHAHAHARHKGLLEDLVRSSEHLQNLCRPLAYTLKLELDNELLTSSGPLSKQLDDWRARLDSCTNLINQLSQFVDTFVQLQSNFIQLKPLIQSIGQAKESTRDTDRPVTRPAEARDVQMDTRESRLNNSLDCCKVNFKQVHQLRKQLAEALRAQVGSNPTQGRPAGMQSRSAPSIAKPRSSTTSGNVALSRFINSKVFVQQGLMQKLQIAAENSVNCCKIINQVSSSLRLEFGRFYFVNDLELLTIISLDTKLISECHLDENRRLIGKMFNNSIDGFVLGRSQPQQQRPGKSERSHRPPGAGRVATASTVERDKQCVSIVGVKTPIGEEIPLVDESPIPIKKRINIYSVEVVRILNEVIRKLRRSLQRLLKQHLDANPGSNQQAGCQLPIQLMVVAEQVEFTKRVETCLSNCRPLDDNRAGQATGSDPDCRQQLDELLQTYERQFKQLRDSGHQVCSSNHLDHLKLSALLSTTVHFMSCLTSLRDTSTGGCSSLGDDAFDWQWRQMPRYYVINEPGGSNDTSGRTQESWRLEVRIGNAKFNYKFDCLPVQVEFGSLSRSQKPAYKRLISTQTSGRCFLVASQAISRLKLGASPFGPAGSGKTETIKALGQLLGCQVIVHNCDESNDSETLDRLIWGLAHTGLWGCFDEFNRLGVSTLSSVSATLELIQSSLRQGKLMIELASTCGDVSSPTGTDDGQHRVSEPMLDSMMRSLDPASAFFITMNPGDGDKYRGRRQLPANIRSLFLSIAMVRVQIDAIASEFLLSFGGELELKPTTQGAEGLDRSEGCIAATTADLLDIKTAKRLGHLLASWMDKVQTNDVIKVCKRCEWDLRLVMAILRRFKALIPDLDYLSKQSDRHVQETRVEQTLVEAIRSELKPRLNDLELVQLELGLKEMFAVGGQQLNERSGSSHDDANNADLVDANRADFEFISAKVEQLGDQLKNRSGVVLVGPSGAGKSTTWRQYCNVSPLVNKITWFAMNPKCCPRERLIGYVDSMDGKWVDGQFTSLVRRSLEQLQQTASLEQVLIVLDGGIDPDWIECLNSVLDDNRMLTLGSGERLAFTMNDGRCIRLIFETTSVEFASPATISRLGLVNYERPLGEPDADKPDARIMVDGQDLTRAAMNNHRLLHGTKSNSIGPRAELHSSLRSPQVVQRFLTSKDVPVRLLILVCPGGADLISAPMEQQVAEFNCSKYSNSRHLIEILQRSAGKMSTLVVKNIHLIEPEDDWNTRTFVELLLFILSYDFYYDPDKQTRRNIGIGQKFIIELDSLDQLRDESRLWSLAAVHLTGETNRSMRDPDEQISRRQKPQVVGFQQLATSINDPSTVIVTLCNVHPSTLAKNQLVDLLQPVDTCDILQFRNQAQVKVAIECLSRLLRQGPNPTVRKVFVLNQMELQLMDKPLASELFQLINLLRLQTFQTSRALIKFIYLAGDRYDVVGGHPGLSFWTSVGQILQLEPKESITRDSIQSQLTDQLNLVNLSKCALFNDQGGFSGLIGMIERLLSDGDNLASGGGGGMQTGNDVSIRNSVNLGEFVELFVQLVNKHWTSLTSLRRILVNGLDCLAQFEKSVERIKSKCLDEEQKLAQIQVDVERLMVEINSKLASGESQRNQVMQLREMQALKRLEVSRRSQDIESKLQKVEPLIESSKTEIKRCLKPEALNEIKTLRAPPKVIKDILDVLFIFLGIQDLSWASIKTQMTKLALRDELVNYDFKQRLDSTMMVKLRNEMQTRGTSLSLEQASRASSAIVPILRWIQAAIKYGEVLVELQPLREELEQLQAESGKLELEMAQLELELTDIDQIIERDQAQLDRLRQSYDTAHMECKQMQTNLDRAQKVRQDLGNQMARWEAKLQLANQSAEANSLLRTCLIAAALASNMDANFGLELGHWWSMLAGGQASNLGANAGQKAPSETGLLMKLISLVDDDLVGHQHNELLVADGSTTGANQRQMLQLAIMKVCLTISSCRLIPFIATSDDSQMCQENLINCLSLKGILCQQDELQIIQPTSGYAASNWRQSIEIALKMDKLIVIPMTYSALDLDILELVAGASGGHTSSQCKRIILIGHWELLDESVQRRLRPFDLLAANHLGSSHLQGSRETSAETSKRLESALVGLFIRCSDPRLSKTTRQVELEIIGKQREAKTMELQLLRRLMITTERSKSMSKSGPADASQASGGEPSARADKLENHQELIGVLSELQLVSENLAKSISELQTKLFESGQKVEKFRKLAHDAAQFYQIFLVEKYHQAEDAFSRLSLKRYAEFLYQLSVDMDSPERKSSRATMSPDELVVCYAMRAMQASSRHQFGLKLLQMPTVGCGLSAKLSADGRGDNTDAIWTKANTGAAIRRAANVEQTVVDLLSCWWNELRQHQLRTQTTGASEPNQATDQASEPPMSGNNSRLMIVQHDAKRPSPQMELDELFSVRKIANLSLEVTQNCSPNSSLVIDYQKIYATAASGGNSSAMFADQQHAYQAKSSPSVSPSMASTAFQSKLIKILSSSSPAGDNRAAGGLGSGFSTKVDDRKINNNNNHKTIMQTTSSANRSSAGRQFKLCVVCIANAHLASSWLNANLIHLIGRWNGSLGSNGSPSDQMLLLILVGEKQQDMVGVERSSSSGHLIQPDLPGPIRPPPSSSLGGFDAKLLDEAHVKYWHDTSTLGLQDRFQLYSNFMLASQLVSCLTAHPWIALLEESRPGAREELAELVDGLILLHVVCQELNETCQLAAGSQATSADPTPSAGPKWQLAGQYRFDLDQLCLAFKLVEQTLDDLLESHRKSCATAGDLHHHLDHPSTGAKPRPIGEQSAILASFWQIRRPVCQQLECIVYGPRLESLADEARLGQLIDLLLGSREVTRKQLACLKRLASLGLNEGISSAAGGDYEKLLEYQQLLAQLTGVEPTRVA